MNIFNIGDVVEYCTGLTPCGNWGVVMEISRVIDSIHKGKKKVSYIR